MSRSTGSRPTATRLSKGASRSVVDLIGREALRKQGWSEKEINEMAREPLPAEVIKDAEVETGEWRSAIERKLSEEGAMVRKVGRAMSFKEALKARTEKATPKPRNVSLDGFAMTAISKSDEPLRTIYGWASVVTKNGKPVVDSQGDMISVKTLTKAFHEFMKVSRVGGVMHLANNGKPIKAGTIVEGLVLDAAVQKALGIDLGKEGLFIGFKVENEAVWKAYKAGKLPAFSIGGRGKRRKVTLAD